MNIEHISYTLNILSIPQVTDWKMTPESIPAETLSPEQETVPVTVSLEQEVHQVTVGTVKTGQHQSEAEQDPYFESSTNDNISPKIEETNTNSLSKETETTFADFSISSMTNKEEQIDSTTLGYEVNTVLYDNDIEEDDIEDAFDGYDFNVFEKKQTTTSISTVQKFNDLNTDVPVPLVVTDLPETKNEENSVPLSLSPETTSASTIAMEVLPEKLALVENHENLVSNLVRHKSTENAVFVPIGLGLYYRFPILDI